MVFHILTEPATQMARRSGLHPSVGFGGERRWKQSQSQILSQSGAVLLLLPECVRVTRGTENTASTEPGLTHSVGMLTLSTPAQSPWTAGVMRGGFVNRMPRPSIASLPTSPHLGKRKA